MRRRRRPQPTQVQAQPAPVPEPEPVDPRLVQQYHAHNPMRDNGPAMPHELDGDGFIEWLILNGMSEDIYWVNVAAGEMQAIDIETNGMPIPTDMLTNDQKGWAQADHFEHFQKEIARWRPIPGKDSKVVPWRGAPRLRDRLYRNQCDDGDNAVLELWGYRWDMRELWQCTLCGEVIIRTPFSTNHNNQED